MGNENRRESTGSVVMDCFLTWVEILERSEKEGVSRNDEVNNRR